jgi:hypothetical protein
MQAKTNSNGSNVHPDISSSPLSVVRVPIFHWRSDGWKDSTLRMLVLEIRNFPRRVGAILRRSHLRFGPSIPTYPTFDSRESQGQGYEFACACNSDIHKLQRDNRWAGPLDLEFAAESYRAGANWAIHNFRNGKDNTVQH